MLSVSLDPPNTLRRAIIADEDLASVSDVKLLITASDSGGVEALAQRVHVASGRRAFPFAQKRARDLPDDPERLKQVWAALLDNACGGTLLITDVEKMEPPVQEGIGELLAQLEYERPRGAHVRLMFGTTVALRQRVAAGAFSERLFYRINSIHLKA